MIRWLTVLILSAAIAGAADYAIELQSGGIRVVDGGIQWSWEPPITTTSLVLQYLMGDVGGTNNTVYTLDTSGNNYTGQVVLATWVGKTNGLASSYSFDGSSNMRILTTNNPALNPKKQITVSAFIKKNGAHESNLGYIASLWSASGTTGNSWSLQERQDYKLYWRLNNATLSINNTSTNKWGLWQHITGTYDGSNAILYVDGAPVASQAYTGDLHTNTTTSMHIGTHPSLGSDWAGGIWGVEIHTNALTATEIAQTNRYQAAELGIKSRYLANNPTQDSNCVLNVTFNNIIQDGSKQGNALTTASAPTLVNVKPNSAQLPSGNAAADFNGSANYLQTEPSPAIDLLFNKTNAFTVAGWVSTANNSVDQMIFSKDNPALRGVTMWGLKIGNALKAAWYWRLDGNRFSKHGQTTISDGNWHHVAVTYDGVNYTNFNIYVNGVAEILSNNNAQAVGSIAVTNPATIGRREYVPTPFYFDGGIDEFIIFTNCLSSAEVLQLYNSQTNLFF